jgi:hypothetical protein
MPGDAADGPQRRRDPRRLGIDGLQQEIGTLVPVLGKHTRARIVVRRRLDLLLGEVHVDSMSAFLLSSLS